MANPNHPKTILCVGASNTLNIPTDNPANGNVSWPGYLRLLASGIGPGWTVVNGGVNGSTVFDLRFILVSGLGTAGSPPCEQVNMISLLHRYRPDIVILTLESNEAQFGTQTTSFAGSPMFANRYPLTPVQSIEAVQHCEEVITQHRTASGTAPLFFTTYLNLAAAFYKQWQEPGEYDGPYTASGFTYLFNRALPTYYPSGQLIDFETGFGSPALYLDELHFTVSACLARGWRAYEHLLPYLQS